MFTTARPSGTTLTALRRQASSCTACPLYRKATQTVFGRGPAHAALVLVGEQPGDQEDREGLPFVGPAGRLLDPADRLSARAGRPFGPCRPTFRPALVSGRPALDFGKPAFHRLLRKERGNPYL